MMRQGQALDLGGGHHAEMVWREGVDPRRGLPTGFIERHLPHPSVGVEQCEAYVAWATSEPGISDPDGLWQLISLSPLTIEPAVSCPRCGIIGRIEDGRWQSRRLPNTPGSIA